jgi:hypothetical protein
MRRALLAIIAALCLCHTALAQDSSVVDKIGSFPDKFFRILNKRTSSLEQKLTRQTEKYLQRLEKKEQKLKRQLYQLDSNKTKNLFLLNTDQRYAAYLQKIRSDTALDPSSLRGTYMPNADTIQGALAFLKQNPSYLSGSNILPGQVQESMAKFNSLEAKMNDADLLQQFIKERKEQIKQYLLQFAQLPPGIRSIYNEYNQEFYYYTQQIKQYKDLLDDPDKLIKTTVAILQKIPLFQSFMAKNSILASLFPNSPGMGGPQGIPGLQTRGSTSDMILAQMSGPNAQQTVSNNMSSAQTELDNIQNRVMNLGQGGADVDIPNFSPNMQRTKTFFQRLEFGTNFQTLSSTYAFPTTTDIGLSVGYLLDDKGNDVGIGASYKIGWGSDINHIKVSSQGASIRSFADIKLKKSFYLSGGMELNYQQPYYSLRKLENLNSWHQSGLVGVSKIISMKTKFFKKTKVQLLWDFLSYQQIPRTQPWIFRINYSF